MDSHQPSTLCQDRAENLFICAFIYDKLPHLWQSVNNIFKFILCISLDGLGKSVIIRKDYLWELNL